MARRISAVLARLVLLGAILATAGPASAVSQPSSDVLVPYFEVDLIDPLRTSLFAIANEAPQPVNVTVTVFTNWGVAVLHHDITIAADAVFTANLRDWLIRGELPGRTLTAAELAHVQSAFCGEPSPLDGLYYGNKVTEGRMTGYLVARVTGTKRPDSLWGDYFIVCPCSDFAQGETLVNLDRAVEYEPRCEHHGIRFLDKGAFSGGTELMIWTAKQNLPSDEPILSDAKKTRLTMRVFAESGQLLEVRHLYIQAVQLLDLLQLDLPADFGWLDLTADVEFFVTAHYSAAGGFSSALHSYCLSERAEEAGPRILLEKRTNGVVAHSPPGPWITVGSAVVWEYTVSNVGDQALGEIELFDDQAGAVSCPQSSLEPQEEMVCAAEGLAVACQYVNTATVSAIATDGTVVETSDTSHYFGDAGAAIAIEKQVEGVDADSPPGPTFDAGSTLHWTVQVSNIGGAELTSVSVTDDGGLVFGCPKTQLAAGETMVCTAQSFAVFGPHRNIATVHGEPPCGDAVTAQDAANYVGRSAAAIDIEKLVNGDDADLPPGPSLPLGSVVQWSYVVTNTGAVSLGNLAVTDNRGVVVNCPKTSLAAGESMTCTGQGSAVLGAYANIGMATGVPAVGPNVTDTDPANYVGSSAPAVTIEKAVNGEDADVAPGPQITYDQPVTWTYAVANTGNVLLTSLVVTDDRGVTVTCPKTVLVPAESMTCTASGKAVYGPYQNIGTVRGVAPDGVVVQAEDPANYTGIINAGIDIEKLTNGEDADLPPGPIIDICYSSTTGRRVPNCSPLVTWTYIVTNIGAVRLTAVTVTDDKGVTVRCPKTALEPSETMTCTASGTATLGQYENIGTARGTPVAGPVVLDTDPSHYLGKSCHPAEGCTPGYWKNHTGSWPPTGYSPSQKVKTVFGNAYLHGLGESSLLTALSFDGGTGLSGAAEILLRAAVAGVLNASHPDVGYPRSAGALIADANTALASTRDVMLSLAAEIDADNNLGCPLH